MEEGWATTAAAKGKGKAIASSSSSEVEIEMNPMLNPSVRPNERLAVGDSRAQFLPTTASTAMELEEALKGEEDHGYRNRSVVDIHLQKIKGAKMAEQSCGVMPEMVDKLNNFDPRIEAARWKKHCIYRVPEFIKEMTNSKAYQPRYVSLGPLHHGERHLLPMEEHKLRAVLHLVKRSGKPLEDFIAAIDEKADELLDAYNDTSIDEKWRGQKNKDGFLKMMVADGCFLLELFRTQGISHGRELDNDYGTNDPIFSVRSYRTFWPIMVADMISIENQLPLVVLQRLQAVLNGISLPPIYMNLRVLHLLGTPCSPEGMDNLLGLHFLDVFYRAYCGTAQNWETSDKYETTRTPCAAELKEAGVQFKKSHSNSIQDVDFRNGMLTMPLFKIYDSTEKVLLNLMAFEWLHPDAQRYVAEYIAFVDGIIESERDVAHLRSKGIIENHMGSDKKVVEMFNTLTKLARQPTRCNKLSHVQWMMDAHCKKRRNKWRAIFMNTYLRNPWVIISMVAAFTLLAAAVLQAVYKLIDFYSRKG